jgi:hypothetical protein
VTAVRTTLAPLVLTALLLGGLEIDAPVAALVGPGRPLQPALRWSLVIGLSLAADLLGAVLLLSLHAFSARNFLVALLALELLAGLGHLLAGRRPTAVVPAEELP